MHCRDLRAGMDVEAFALDEGATVLVVQPSPRVVARQSFAQWYAEQPERRRKVGRRYHDRRKRRTSLGDTRRRDNRVRTRRVGDRMTLYEDLQLAVHLDHRGHAR